ncbi:MAG: hypothetical protein K2H52_14675 [Lachnospiraceae bacterium]|nr:hypothetical protein [Lachnospiraceae bacterium]
MQYRKLPKGAEQISVLGIGTSSIQASSEKEIEEIMDAAIENGINFFDMASSEAKPFAAYGHAIKGRHIGLSSHTPELVSKVLDMGILDMLMFSINPAYDYADAADYELRKGKMSKTGKML